MEEGLHAFQTLREACITTPVLVFADYEKSFLLETDASKEGLGAVLLQKQADGHYHLVAYGSWALTAQEQNYHSNKLEFLALKWAITEHFKEYLPWKLFIIWTEQSAHIHHDNTEPRHYNGIIGFNHSWSIHVILNTRRDETTPWQMSWVGWQGSMLRQSNQSTMVSIWKLLDEQEPMTPSDQGWK